jgi:hypothetical protein
VEDVNIGKLLGVNCVDVSWRQRLGLRLLNVLLASGEKDINR